MEAAVGILQSASQCLISEKFRDITEDFDGKLSEMKKESKNRSRCKTSKVFFRCILNAREISLKKCHSCFFARIYFRKWTFFW